MLNFDYTTDQELKVQPGQLPSGIQTQAFEMAATHMSRKFNNVKRMLNTRTQTGAPPIAGLSKQWQERLQAESDFVGGLPDQLLRVARQVALGDGGDAIVQGSLRGRWNTWAPEALSAYSRTLSAFETDVSKAMGNMPIIGMPAVYVKMAQMARTEPPVVPHVTNSSLGAYTEDDAAYLESLDLNVMGREIPNIAIAGVVGLLGWWLWKRSGWEAKPKVKHACRIIINRKTGQRRCLLPAATRAPWGWYLESEGRARYIVPKRRPAKRCIRYKYVYLANGKRARRCAQYSR
jgi:hypothetical protein